MRRPGGAVTICVHNKKAGDAEGEEKIPEYMHIHV